MAGWRPPDSTPIDEIREARSALTGAREFLEAEQGRPGRVDLAVLTGGNSLALQLLHDALGYRTTNVRKRSARSAIATASRVLEEVSRGRDPTVEKAVFRSLARSTKAESSRDRGATVDEVVEQSAPVAPVVGAGDSAGTDRRSPAAPQSPSEKVTAPPHEASSVQVRRLTDAGVKRAKEFLTYMREHPGAKREPPREILFGDHYSRPFRESVRVERRHFRTRREAAEYFAPKFAPIRHLVADHAELWSWLAMYYFTGIVGAKGDEVRVSRQDERFVIDRHDSRLSQMRVRNYLWISWLLYETHGESVSFLLDQELTSASYLSSRALEYVRIFNSTGTVQLILRLYTHNGRQKQGMRRRSGGLEQLIRVLDQLERTYDVYGMSPDALIRILPEEFRRWDSQSAPRALDGVVPAEPVPRAAETSPAYPTPTQPVRGEPVNPGGEPVVPARGEPVEPHAHERPPIGTERTETAPVRQTLLQVRERIELQGQVSWADPREHLEEGSEAWEVYVAVCGVPERRLFRTAFLHRLNEVLASLD